MKPIIDKVLGWTISKKLTVYALACFFFYIGKITNVQWYELSIVYIGTQTVIDIVKQIKSSR